MDNKPVNDPLPQSNQSSPQPENTAAKSFFRLPILLTILAGAILIGSASVLASKFFFQPKPPQPMITPIPTQTLSSDPTADWKIYINTKYGFEFKYPLQALIQDFKTENNISYFETKMSDFVFGIRVENNPKLIIDDLNNNKTITSPLTEKNINRIVPDGPNEVINFQGRVTNRSKDSDSSISYYILDNNNLVVLSGKGKIVLFDQILSTFKFLGKPEILNVTKIPSEIPEELKCVTSEDCGINTCSCQVMNKKYVAPEGKICMRECDKTPVCFQKRCIAKGEENKYEVEVK